MSAPTTPTTSVEETLDLVAAEETIWVRVAAIRQDGGSWRVRLMELTSGAPPPNWEAVSWEYTQVVFAALAETGDTVAAWLRAGEMTQHDIQMTLPDVIGPTNWQRRQGFAPAAYERLEWPATEASLSSGANAPSEPHGHLVSPRGAPSFIDVRTAAACFFSLDPQPGRTLHQGVMYRHQDTRARITRVRIADDGIDVDIEGPAMHGLTVELAGDVPGTSQRIWTHNRTHSESMHFPLKGGLPPGAWVLVRVGDEWIDRRFLATSLSLQQEPGVEVVIEPRTRLEAFIADREGPQVEFKRQVPKDDDNKLPVMKTVCAFTNGPGGSILFGIDDDHNIVGLPMQMIDRLRDQLTQTIGSWVDPRPTFSFEVLPVENEKTGVLELYVARGTRLYGCARPGDTPSVYVRHHATTVKARPAEIEEIVRSRALTDVATPWWHGGRVR